MSAVTELRLRMYLVLFLVFAIGFAILAALLSLLGFSATGIVIVAVFFFLIQWYVSPSVIAHMAHLKYVSKQQQPKLYEMVESLAKQANVPMPKIAISPSRDPNAFVFGRTRRSATLVVNQGLLSSLDDGELYAVLAHEIGHLKHNDASVMTFAAFVPMLAYYVALSLMFSGGFGNRRNAGYAAIIGMLSFLVYFLSELIMLALSRAREAYADSYSAEATKKPESLASALVKITYSLSGSPSMGTDAMRSFYIADNLTAKKDAKGIERYLSEIKKAFPQLSLSAFRQEVEKERSDPFAFFGSLFLTHPPTYKRILLLARMKNEQSK